MLWAQAAREVSSRDVGASDSGRAHPASYIAFNKIFAREIAFIYSDGAVLAKDPFSRSRHRRNGSPHSARRMLSPPPAASRLPAEAPLWAMPWAPPPPPLTLPPPMPPPRVGLLVLLVAAAAVAAILGTKTSFHTIE